jgi:predicted acyl esterase
VDQSLGDDPCYASSQGEPDNDDGAGSPVGVDKLSYTNVFYAYGHGASNGGGFQVEDACDTPPPELASVDAWYQRIVTTGEPYEDSDPLVKQIRHGLTECRSSYYQDEGWKAQADGPRRVAVFSIQGWTDDLFGAVESFRQFKYLKKLNPRWPVSVALADVGHPRAKNNPDTWRALNQQAWQWLQSNINGSNDQETTVSGQQTVCDNGDGQEDPNDPNQNITATTPERLSNGKVSVTYAGGGTTTSEEPDPNGPVTDPVANSAVGEIIPRPGNCPTSAGPAPYTGFSQPLPGDRTYVGLGSVTVPYELTGTTAQLDTRVWDVPPGSATNAVGSTDCQKRPTPKGCPLLISRGTYRLDTPTYDSPTGQLRIPLMGNQYRLAKGHKIRLDLTQLDAPYLRASNAPSTIKFTSPTLSLPTRDSATTTLKGAGG